MSTIYPESEPAQPYVERHTFQITVTADNLADLYPLAEREAMLVFRTELVTETGRSNVHRVAKYSNASVDAAATLECTFYFREDLSKPDGS